jgi:hypothetical protein
MPFPLLPLAILGGSALAGGAASAMSKRPRLKQISTLNPQQQQLQTQAGNLAFEGLKNPTTGFQPIEQQAREQFQTSTIPSLAERFTSMGSGGQRSSAFQGALGQAGAGLEGNLAALRSEYGLRQQGLSQNLLGQALHPNFENYYQPNSPGFLESSLGSLAGAGGQYGSMMLGQQLGGFGRYGQQNQNQNQMQGGQATNALLSQILQLLQRQGAA